MIKPSMGLKKIATSIRKHATRSVGRSQHAVERPSIPFEKTMLNDDIASECGTSTITIDAVPDSLMRCNSPFLDAIFGGSATGKDMTSMVVNQHHPTQFHMHDRGSERERERDLCRYRHTDKDRDSKGIPNWQKRQIIARAFSLRQPTRVRIDLHVIKDQNFSLGVVKKSAARAQQQAPQPLIA